MGNWRLGLQFWPWYSCDKLVKAAGEAVANYDFEQIWMDDNPPYENLFVTLGAMAARNEKTGLGTAVTLPHARNPIDVASGFAAAANMLLEGRVTVGLGTGQDYGLGIGWFLERIKPRAFLRETVQILRVLLDGKSIRFDEFPVVSSFFNLKPQRDVHLILPPKKKVDIAVSAYGPKMGAIAGRYADTLMISQFSATGGLKGLEEGWIKPIIQASSEARRSGGITDPQEKIYVSHISVSRDGEKAKRFVCRNLSYVIGFPHYGFLTEADFKALGLTPQLVQSVREYFTKQVDFGENKEVDVIGKILQPHIIETTGMAIAGTPRECIEDYQKLFEALKPYGFNRVIIGVPLGPDLDEAIQLLGREVLPSL